MTEQSVRIRAGGHVFVLHGRVEHVVHDAVVIPTAGAFHVRDYWKPVLGGSRQGIKPTDWPRPFARSARGDDIWFLNVGGFWRSPSDETVDEMVQRVCELVSEIVASGITAASGRVKPLIAMPVVGVGGGGLGNRQGLVVTRLLDALVAHVSTLDVDVAIVTPHASVHAAAQHLRRQGNPWGLDHDSLEQAKELGDMAARGQLALFFGAGVSVPAGLPRWSDLLKSLARDNDVPESDMAAVGAPLDQAQLLEHLVPDLPGQIKRTITRAATRPSLAHVLLASLRCREAVTTNYDRLYETAVRAAGGTVVSILPWEPVTSAKPWVLKMHGDVEVEKSIVLTRRHFVRYDAMTRPSGALLQALMLTRHVVIVGASLTDDNVVRLAYEVSEYLKYAGRSGPYGTMLDVAGHPAMGQVWQEQLAWLPMPGDDLDQRARALEIFLDAVSAFASSDSSWLLDAKFGHLVQEDEALAHRARELFRDIPQTPTWEPLREFLRSLGAESEDGKSTPRFRGRERPRMDRHRSEPALRSDERGLN